MCSKERVSECVKDNNVISAEGIYENINFPIDFKNIHTYNSVDSTNTLAKSIAMETDSFTIVTANEQTKGRGRMGRSFFSPAGTGIYVSIILKPNITIDKSALVTTSAAVAVCNTIEKFTDYKPSIKWVNDVLINGKKVCGILAEAVSDFENGVVRYVVVGIGINYSSNIFPNDIKDKCCTIYEDYCSVSKNKWIGELCNQIYKITRDIENPTTMQRYKKLSCVIGKEVSFIEDNKKVYGRALDIDDKGALLLDVDKEMKVLSYGEISIRVDEYDN